MKFGIIIIILCSLLTSCCQEEHLKIVYKIPPDKQEAASKMLISLVEACRGGEYNPEYYQRTSLETVSKIYGEPVEFRNK